MSREKGSEFNKIVGNLDQALTAAGCSPSSIVRSTNPYDVSINLLNGFESQLDNIVSWANKTLVNSSRQYSLVCDACLRAGQALDTLMNTTVRQTIQVAESQQPVAMVPPPPPGPPPGWSAAAAPAISGDSGDAQPSTRLPQAYPRWAAAAAPEISRSKAPTDVVRGVVAPDLQPWQPTEPSAAAASAPRPITTKVKVDYDQLAAYIDNSNFNERFFRLVYDVATKNNWNFNTKSSITELDKKREKIVAMYARSSQQLNVQSAATLPLVDYFEVFKIKDNALFLAVVNTAKTQGWRFDQLVRSQDATKQQQLNEARDAINLRVQKLQSTPPQQAIPQRGAAQPAAQQVASPSQITQQMAEAAFAEAAKYFSITKAEPECYDNPAIIAMKSVLIEQEKKSLLPSIFTKSITPLSDSDKGWIQYLVAAKYGDPDFRVPTEPPSPDLQKILEKHKINYVTLQQSQHRPPGCT